MHFARHGGPEGRAPHPLFDPHFYWEHGDSPGDRAINPLVDFLQVGGGDGRKPNAWFDVEFYLANAPDVAAAGMNALEHYVRAGWREGRNPHPDFDVDEWLWPIQTSRGKASSRLRASSTG